MRRIAMMIAGLTATAPAAAAAPPTAPAAFEALLACRSLTDPTQRLACYDGKVAVLQEAEAKRDIVVVDREQMHETHKALFGFNLPNLNLFGDKDGKAGHGGDDDIREVTEVVKSVSPDAAGNWVVALANGATWHQTEGTLALAPKPGTSVTIRRGALGSYFMRVGSQPGVKVRRES